MGEWAKRRYRPDGTHVTNGTKRIGPIRTSQDIRGARHIAHSPFRLFAVSPQRRPFTRLFRPFGRSIAAFL